MVLNYQIGRTCQSWRVWTAKKIKSKSKKSLSKITEYSNVRAARKNPLSSKSEN